MLNELKAMAIFAEVVKKGSFREAAKSLSLSPSVVSYHISQLEDKVGAALIYRSTRQLTLSHDGDIFYSYVKQMMDAANQGLEQLLGQNIEPSGTIKISLPTALSGSYINNLITMFSSQFPKITLNLSFTDTRSNIIDDGLDLVIRAGELDNSNLKSKKIGYLDRVLVCSPSYLKKHKTPEILDELSTWSWIKLEQIPSERNFRSENIEKRLKYQYKISVNSVEAMHHYCLLGVGLATLAKSQVTESLESGRLVHVLPNWEVEPIPLYALWPNNLTPSSNVKKLLNYLTSMESKF